MVTNCFMCRSNCTDNYMLNVCQIFNDNMLKIRVKRCVRTAIKLRRKYFYKVVSANLLALDFYTFSCSVGSLHFPYKMHHLLVPISKLLPRQVGLAFKNLLV